MQRWAWLIVAVAGAWSALSILTRDGSWWLALMVAVVTGLAAWWISPWKGGRSMSHAHVMSLPARERAVVVYWRPGCGFCARLSSVLEPVRDRAQWVNIWQDDAARDFVRTVNNGNEVVPTVVIDGEPHANPDPEAVLQRLVG
jgi:glutaredoxin